MIQITHCPPSERPSLHYDKHNFNRSGRMIAATRVSRDEDGLLDWQSTGIALSEVDHMNGWTPLHNLAKGRRFDPPSFAVNDKDLRLVIVHAIERRAYGSSKRILDSARHTGLTLVERLKRAEDKCRARAGRMSTILDRLCREFVTLRNDRTDDKRLGTVQTLIQQTDTQLRIDQHPAEVYGYILYSYFRTGAASHQVAADLGLHAPAIRQLLFRICTIAKQELNFNLGDALQKRKTEYEERCRAEKAAAKAERAVARAAVRAVRKLETAELRKEERERLNQDQVIKTDSAHHHKARVGNRAAGLCSCGSERSGGFKMCAKCREQQRAWQAKRRAGKVA